MKLHPKIKAIYKITSPTGRVYIGQSIDLKRRIAAYKNLRCEDQKKIFASLKKYGWANHSFDVLYEFPVDVEQLIIDTYEILYIAQYQSNCNKYSLNGGMNLNDGGCGNNGYKHTEEQNNRKSSIQTGKKRKPFSEETKAKMALAKLGKKRPVRSAEYRANISKSMMGKKNGLGHIVSEEQKQIHSDFMKGKQTTLGYKWTPDQLKNHVSVKRKAANEIAS